MGKLIVGNRTIDCELVVFDKDGTLIDLHLVLFELAKARRASIQKSGGKEIANLWERVVGTDLRNGKIDHDGPLATAPRQEEVLVAAAAFYLNGNSWTEAKRLAHEAYDEADESLESPYGSVLLKGVPETLDELKRHGLRLAVASTDTHRRTLESLKALQIASLFEAMIGGDDVINGKPSPDMVHEILKRTGSKAYETVIVGDSVSDMQMGRNAKIKACIGVLTGSTKREKLEKFADVVVDSMVELRAL